MNVAKTGMFVTPDGKPFLQSSEGNFVYLKNLFGYDLPEGNPQPEMDDFHKWRPAFPVTNFSGFSRGRMTVTVIIGGSMFVVELVHVPPRPKQDNPRRDEVVERIMMTAVGGLYENIDLNVPCQADWVVQSTRPVGEAGFEYPRALITERAYIFNPKPDLKPKDLTPVIIARGERIRPGLAWVDGSRNVSLCDLDDVFENGELRYQEVATPEEDWMVNFRTVELKGLTSNPIVRRGQRSEIAIRDGLPKYYVSVQARILPRFVGGKDAATARRFSAGNWTVFNSHDGLNWFMPYVTKNRDSYLSDVNVYEAQLEAARQVERKQRKQNAAGNSAEASSESLEGGENATVEGASATPTNTGKKRSSRKSKRQPDVSTDAAAYTGDAAPVIESGAESAATPDAQALETQLASTT